MKSPLFLPVYLVSVFLLCLAALTGSSLMWVWMELAPYGARGAALWAFTRIVPLAQDCLPAALLPALLLTGLRVARIPVSRPFSLLLPAATAFCLLYFGPIALRALPSPAGQDPSPVLSTHLPAGVLVEATDTTATPVVFRADTVVGEESGVELSGIVVHRPTAMAPRLAYHATGQAARDDRSIAIRVDGETLRAPFTPPLRDLVEPSESTNRLLADLRTLNRELARPRTQVTAVLTAVGVVAFFWFTCLVLRLTKWPLLSIVLLGLMWRGALVAIRFVADVVRPALIGLLEGAGWWQRAAEETVTIALLVVATLALAFDLVFVRFDFWKREIEV